VNDIEQMKMLKMLRKKTKVFKTNKNRRTYALYQKMLATNDCKII
jgi:hypothetical protein